ncbi:hypothetical protein DDB_G0272170 [Dictyostelium discoideum AX4]|uniref:Uncharacterized protein n=1 Tax=Dictyostelium discoideum TaxID=44689 RepID=Q75JV7_DICDI|nr:hypothetical protein DDB_G0272170 [Dictyostelium discoideum AX4]EAL71237.1 hypothetical protein DDB_G0272170 [Dictyostelium discoideum AX4]|eukprot:XP_645232.1 hypothetical protein DDB_G0272170 [Dictyostelium discoideum AX4]
MNRTRIWLLVFIGLGILTLMIYFIPSINQIVYSSGISYYRPKSKFSIADIDYEAKGKNFTYDMNNFPWEEFKAAARTGKTDNTDKYSQMLILTLSTYLIEPPLVPIDESCQPEPLPPIDDSVCTSKYSRVFSGKRDKPVKIGHMVQIGFDVDVLEIHLNELYDVVDHFFIIESTVTHYHKMLKPLIWEHVKFQDRFLKFKDKVVHLVLDDTDEENGKGLFDAESYQETRRWQKFLDWNKRTNLYSDEDIIGFGDTDEISARINLHLLKNCQLKSGVDMVDIGIWFPYGPINQVFNPDFPVPSNPYTLGDPTYYTIKKAKSTTKAPSRNRGTSGHYMLGGMHMTHYGYLPFQMVKYLSCTECGITREDQITLFSNDIGKGDIQKLELRLLETKSDHAHRIRQLSSMDDFFKKEVAILPWFYNCNRNRYPVWERKNDPRLF